MMKNAKEFQDENVEAARIDKNLRQIDEKREKKRRWNRLTRRS